MYGGLPPTSISTQLVRYQVSMFSTSRFPFSNEQTLLSHGNEKNDDLYHFFVRNSGSEEYKVSRRDVI